MNVPGRARFLRSTTARLFLPLVLFQMLATGGVLVFVWFAGQQALQRDRGALVSELRDDLLADYREGGLDRLRATIETRQRFEGRRAPVMLLVDAKGGRIAGNLDAWPPNAGNHANWIETELYRSSAPEPESMVLSVSPLPGGARLLAGWAIERDLRLRRSYEQALVAALLLAVPLTMMVALFVSRLTARRVHGLANTAHLVASGSLEARVPLDGSGDSFDELSREINFMLERIEMLVGELRLVTDGLAHDLRSPVTRLRSALERAAAEAHEPAVLAALERAGAEAESLMSMLTTALQISRAEAGIGRDRFEATDIGGLIDELVELYGPLAEEHGFELVAEAPRGLFRELHRELVGQALGNMIDNAIKYATGGNRILLFARPHRSGLSIGVRDNGPGIPAERHEDARRRFGRLDPARGTAGSGLGLALIEAVARLHGGHMQLLPAEPGLCVSIDLPG